MAREEAEAEAQAEGEAPPEVARDDGTAPNGGQPVPADRQARD
jgi:hypothetical protein